MKLKEVTSAPLKADFLKCPVRLYKNDPNWIRPLNKDIESVFDTKQNKLLRQGQCIRWVLYNDKGNIIGRVAAFINKQTAKKNDQPTGGMGFFECIDDQKAAFMLFDACKNWLQKQGMEAMDGPINFGERDKWWGLLVDGFYPANYCMPYNPPYYQALFEAYGFKLYFNQLTFHRLVNEGGLNEIVKEKADRIFRDEAYQFRTVNKKKLEQFAEDFLTVYNKAWAKHSGVSAMRKAQAVALMKSIKPIMDERLLVFAYYNNEPIAFYLMLPEINPLIGKLNGQFNLLAKLKFLYYKKRGLCKKMFGVAFGIVPEFQKKGLEGAIVVYFSKIAWDKSFPYEELELNWIGDFNPKMIRVVEQMGCSVRKTHRTYRMLFDPSKPFERAPIIK